MLKSDWLPTMPLHIAIWSQVVLELDLDWADQGMTIRLLANAWSSTTLKRAGWATDRAWEAAERLWPELDAERQKNLDTRESLSRRGKSGADARWNGQGMQQPLADDDSANATAKEQKQKQKQYQKQQQEQQQEQKHQPETHSERRASRVASVCPGFDDFWASYPRREARKNALRAWAKNVTPEDLPALSAGLERWCASEQWERGIIPHPATWLNRRGWEDEPMSAPAPRPATAAQASRDSIVRAMTRMGVSA